MRGQTQDECRVKKSTIGDNDADAINTCIKRNDKDKLCRCGTHKALRVSFGRRRGRCWPGKQTQAWLFVIYFVCKNPTQE